MLQLQHLTRKDIGIVVHARLKGTRAAELCARIVTKAEGVFLWAHLMTKDVRKCMMAGDSIEALKELVNDVSDHPLASCS
jgi:hypothetical protein